MQLPEADLLKAANSVEYKLFQYVDRINQALVGLLNCGDIENAKSHIKTIRLSARDLEKTVSLILQKWGCPPMKINNVGQRTQPTLDNQVLNMGQYYMRFAHARQQYKAQNLTAFYHLVKDVAAIAEVTAPEKYARELIL
jgi:hypothetical protein